VATKPSFEKNRGLTNGGSAAKEFPVELRRIGGKEKKIPGSAGGAVLELGMKRAGVQKEWLRGMRKG